MKKYKTLLFLILVFLPIIGFAMSNWVISDIEKLQKQGFAFQITNITVLTSMIEDSYFEIGFKHDVEGSEPRLVRIPIKQIVTDWKSNQKKNEAP